MEINETKTHLQKVDILRAVAILLVFGLHSYTVLFPNYLISNYTDNGFLEIDGIKNILLNFNPFVFGWAGVHLFLVISGFLIHLGYLKKQETFNTKTFYSKRFWRIYPPYFLILLFFAFFFDGLDYMLFKSGGLTDFISHVFLVHNFSDTTFFTVDGPFWSLALEVQLYILYPLFLFFRKKSGLKKTMIGLIIFTLFFKILGICNNDFGTKFSYDWSVLQNWIVWCSGAYLAECYLKKKKIFGSFPFLFFVLFFAMLMASKYYFYSNSCRIYFATATWIAFCEWFLYFEKINLSSKISKALITTGLCSYSIYLIHYPFLPKMLEGINIIKYSTTNVYVNYFNLMCKPIAVFLVVFLISYAFYKLVELPSIEYGRKLRSKKK